MLTRNDEVELVKQQLFLLVLTLEFVKHTKKKTLADVCNDIEINDTYASIAKLGDAL